MRQNIGDADRTLRMMAGVLLAMLFFIAIPPGTGRVIAGLVTIVLLLSAMTGWSLLYFALRKSTRSDKDAKPLDPG